MSHPHLVPAAVERQLEQFQTDIDGDNQKREPPASGTDLVLYRFALYLISDTLLSVFYDHIVLINLEDSFLLFSKFFKKNKQSIIHIYTEIIIPHSCRIRPLNWLMLHFTLMDKQIFSSIFTCLAQSKCQ